MATTTKVVQRSDLYPPETVVKAYAGAGNRHFAGAPSGEPATEATVDAAGRLTLVLSDAAPVYQLHAVVGGVNRPLALGATPLPPPLGTLQERIAARQSAAGV